MTDLDRLLVRLDHGTRGIRALADISHILASIPPDAKKPVLWAAIADIGEVVGDLAAVVTEHHEGGDE